MERATVRYSLGNERNPGDPFGRSELVIEPDGAARLDHFWRGGKHLAWTGCVDRSALDRLWAALARAEFPSVPDHKVTGGATLRTLTIAGKTALVELFAAKKLAGYDETFAVLDAVIRQLSENTVDGVAAGAQTMVNEIVRVPAP